MIAANHDPDDLLPPAESSAPQAARRRVRALPLMLGMAAGLAIAAAGVLVYAILSSDRAPRLTRAAYEAAVKRWDEHGPASYNLDLELTGNRPGVVHVEVRDGQAVRMTRDGVQPRQERTWFYWTVPGQFDTMAEELEMAENPAKSFNNSAATQMVIWAEFDPQLGYPQRYDRVVLGTDFEIHWRVKRFEAVSAESSQDSPAKK